ncbi:hypothetical protein BU26DRAFT_518233 [Trematosphaeria pertusa]|uniref:Uncharacterized protein n=1 Tax=Trematosphaeria pertusa TaxID=390896 RepID=A0A6A6IID1_9PLEO|nr:uncharacterized protein BU26DRAFT_518233 [Trematosphaeria pertusa]KAF2249652.1 hypothetical protein BU26DRAFT_518233 [Trematosphaeria pertusa]
METRPLDDLPWNALENADLAIVMLVFVCMPPTSFVLHPDSGPKPLKVVSFYIALLLTLTLRFLQVLSGVYNYPDAGSDLYFWRSYSPFKPTILAILVNARFWSWSCVGMYEDPAVNLVIAIPPDAFPPCPI